MSTNILEKRVSSRATYLEIGSLCLGFAIVAACGGEGDGSVGVGSGQDPDPVAVDFPIAYTKGPLLDGQGQLLVSTDLRTLERFNVGTDLYVRDRASPSAVETNVTESVTLGMGDVIGVQISADGNRVLFAMRGPFDPNLAAEDQPSWNIWEYDIELDALRRIIPSDILAEDGQDIFPHYLPDGRIVFSSTRQRQSQAILLDEGKPQFEYLDENRNEFASVLHVMNADGSDIHQVSFNQSHDLTPSVLDNGQVLFSRWDRALDNNGIHLYRMNPDGSELELYYGAESHLTGTNGGEVQFAGAHEMEDGRVMAILRPFDHPELGGDVVIIDVQTYVENAQPTAANAGLTGPAQSSGTTNLVTTDLAPSRGGRFRSAFPLWDGTQRVFTSWSNCRLVIDQTIVPCTDQNLADPTAVVADPLYGIWMYDPVDNTQLPIVVGEEGVLITDVVAAQPRRTPTVIPDKAAGVGLDADFIAEGVGVLNIRSVYDIDGVDTAPGSIVALADPAQATADQRPARFVRVEKAVSIPDDDIVDLDDTAFGPDIRAGMREIVTYGVVEPDGSVRVKVPADVPLAVTVLDADGHRISPRHRNWIQVRSGDEVRCNGCHSEQSGLSHGRADSFDSINAGSGTNGVPFANALGTVITDVGETMAEARTRVSCQTDCADLDATLDVAYADVWTDPTVRAPDASFSFEYSGLTTLAPTTIACMASWTKNCRSVINYEQHIHPLWTQLRQVIDPNDGVTVLADNTCASGGCHTSVDALGATVVPAAQLDLSDGQSPDEPDHFKSYQELLFADNEQQITNGALQDVLTDIGPDANGNPVLVNVSVASPMSAAGANQSDRFFSRFAPGSTHDGFLSPHELRLIAEWLDIGAQYYNNPFDVPQN